MEKLIKAVVDGYRRIHKLGLDGDMFSKSGEGKVSVNFNHKGEIDSVEIYSYDLGPNRNHYFYKADFDKQQDSNIWYCIDPIETATEVFNSWVQNYIDLWEK